MYTTYVRTYVYTVNVCMSCVFLLAYVHIPYMCTYSSDIQYVRLWGSYSVCRLLYSLQLCRPICQMGPHHSPAVPLRNVRVSSGNHDFCSCPCVLCCVPMGPYLPGAGMHWECLLHAWATHHTCRFWNIIMINMYFFGIDTLYSSVMYVHTVYTYVCMYIGVRIHKYVHTCTYVRVYVCTYVERVYNAVHIRTYVFHYLLGSDSQSSSDTQSADSSSRISTQTEVVRIVFYVHMYVRTYIRKQVHRIRTVGGNSH